MIFYASLNRYMDDVKIECKDIMEAKEKVYDMLCYNQQSVQLYDSNHKLLCESVWYDGDPDEDAQLFGVLARFGHFGYYADWEVYI